jgi:deazaflavin-dependent oxidoreductase (nitroreductase family)
MSQWVDEPNVVQRGIRRLIAVRLAAWGLSHTFHRLDRAVLRLSGGRMTPGAVFTGLPIISLTTTGARSGQTRSVPLVGIPDGDRLILIASNWGQDKHPAWYHNVKADPRVTVGSNGQSREYIAREVTGEEREACWQRALALYPGYGAYAVRTGRTIPVIVLE